VKYVLIDGVKFEPVEEPPAQGGRGAPTEAAPPGENQ
jgi:hypothetical protein